MLDAYMLCEVYEPCLVARRTRFETARCVCVCVCVCVVMQDEPCGCQSHVYKPKFSASGVTRDQRDGCTATQNAPSFA